MPQQTELHKLYIKPAHQVGKRVRRRFLCRTLKNYTSGRQGQSRQFIYRIIIHTSPRDVYYFWKVTTILELVPSLLPTLIWKYPPKPFDVGNIESPIYFVNVPAVLVIEISVIVPNSVLL